MELRNLGARVRLFDTNGGDLGFAHVPGPVEPDDLIALSDGLPWRVVVVIELDDSAALDAICQVEPAPPERRSGQ